MKRFLAASAIIVSSFSAASAQDEVREDGPYFRIGGGVTFVSDLDQDFDRSPFIATCLAIGCNPDRRIVSPDTGFVAGAALGFDYADGIRTELEYRYAMNEVSNIRLFEGESEAGDFGGVGPVSTADVDINAHFVLSNFYFDFYNDSPITPFIGGGVGGAFVDVGLGERDAALAYQGRAGFSLAIGGGFSADLEYIYLRTNKLRYGPKPEEFTPTGPFALAVTGANYEASNVMLSLRKPF
ncbi:MAG: P44/Msp2 family outer membrane protein [Pseudomonadota bacterium]